MTYAEELSASNPAHPTVITIKSGVKRDGRDVRITARRIRAVHASGAPLLPIDSEHNAIFQVFESRNRAAVDRIILTASGGPFREFDSARMAGARLDVPVQ